MREPYKIVLLLGLCGLALPLRAQIELNTITESDVSAAGTFNGTTQTGTNQVNSLPYTQSVMAVNEESLSTVTPDLTTASLQFAFTESYASSPSSNALGSGVINFIAESNASYTIAASETLQGPQISSIFLVSLYNSTSQQYLLDSNQHESSSGTATLMGSSNQPLSGTLISGDAYQFQVEDRLSGMASGSLTGTSGITFAVVPEPSSVALLGIGLLAAGLALNRKSTLRIRC
jgi:hypothetical protein